jgi:hypothetical protein
LLAGRVPGGRWDRTSHDAKLRAARAEVSLEPGEQFTILFLLSQEPDDELRQRALDTLENLPVAHALQALEQGLAPPVIDLIVRQRCDEEELLVRAVDLAETSDETLAFLAALPHKAVLEAVSRNDKRVLRSPAILEALGANPLSSRAMVDRILFLFGLRQKRMMAAAGRAASQGAAEQPSGPAEQDGDVTALASEMEGDDLPQDLTEEVEAAPNEKRLDQHNLIATIKRLTVFQKIKSPKQRWYRSRSQRICPKRCFASLQRTGSGPNPTRSRSASRRIPRCLLSFR